MSNWARRLDRNLYDRAFTPEMKASTVQMTQYIEDAMKQDIEQLTWMSPETKKNALEKLHTIVNKVGYPDKWRDYSTVDQARRLPRKRNASHSV